MTNPLLTQNQAAQYLGLKPSTLAWWRSQTPDRLPFLKNGRIIRYRQEDIENFAKEMTPPAATGEVNRKK